MVLFKKINVDEKQDKLTAGTNITITDNVISASGGGGGATGNFVTLDTFQEITGEKDFKKAASFYGNLYCFNDPADKYGVINKENLDTNLALKADKLVVPINASADTSTTINDRVVKTIFKEFTSTGDSVIATTDANINFLNGNILRQKDGGSWGIVVSSAENELYIAKDNKIRFNIQTLTGYANNIKLLVEYT